MKKRSRYFILCCKFTEDKVLQQKLADRLGVLEDFEELECFFEPYPNVVLTIARMLASKKKRRMSEVSKHELEKIFDANVPFVRKSKFKVKKKG